MCNEGDDRSNEQGWRQVRDYCQRFGREHLLKPYLYDGPNHGQFSRPTILSHKTEYATIGTTSDLRTHKMESGPSCSNQFSKSNEDIRYNADASIKEGSPDSGITSRKLEWDSLADIGYENVNLGESQNRNTFSTIERIVLDRNLKIDISSTSNRSDKSNTKQDFSSSPNARSTPTSLSNPNSSKSSNRKVNVKSKNTTQSSGSKEYKNFKSLTVNLEINKPEKKVVSNKKFPKSSTNSAKIYDKQHINLDETTQTSNVRSENKEVQTSAKKVRQPVYIIKRRIPKVSIGKLYQPKEVEDCDLEIEVDTGLENQSDVAEEATMFKSDDNILISADSFEFVPGHAYKTSPSTEYNNTKSSIDSKSNTSSINHSEPIYSSRFKDKETSIPSSIRISSDSSNDLIDKLISRHCKRPDLKAKISEKIVKILKNDNSDIENINSVKEVKETAPKIDEQCQTELQSNDNMSAYSSAKSVKNGSHKSLESKNKSEEASIESLSKSSSCTSTDLDKKLNKINADISSLLLMKVKLENEQNGAKKNYFKTISSSIVNEREINIPLLDLKSSSEDVSEFEKEISEQKNRSKRCKELVLNTETYTKDDKLPSKDENSHCTCNSNNMCSFCAINLAESTSVSSNASKTTSELVRFEKAYSTYKKCKVMKSFLKDYDGLVKRYRKMKLQKKETDKHSIKSNASMSSGSSSKHRASNIEELPDGKSSGVKSSMSESQSRMSESQKISSSARTSKKSDSFKGDQMLLKEICETLKVLDNKFNVMQRTPLAKLDHSTQIPSLGSTVRSDSNKTSVKSKARSDVQSHLNYVDSSQNKSSRDAESYKSRSSIKCCCKGEASKPESVENSRKPLAYNLVLQPSDSVLYESFQHRRKSLDVVVVKVPKLQPKNARRVLRTPKSLDSNRGESTDEQLRELSSLNSARSGLSRSIRYEVPAEDKDKIMTVKEYLYQNRPCFVNKADNRRCFILESQRLRNEREEELRRQLENGVANMSVSEMNLLIRKRSWNFGLTRNKRLFNSQEIKRNTEKQYKNLPEILNKNKKLKKESYNKTNKLMAEIFAKKLQQRTLKGTLNAPLCTNVMAL